MTIFDFIKISSENYTTNENRVMKERGENNPDEVAESYDKSYSNRNETRNPDRVAKVDKKERTGFKYKKFKKWINDNETNFSEVDKP